MVKKSSAFWNWRHSSLGSPAENIYTVGPRSVPSETHWETDSGCNGYGMPKFRAEFVTHCVNKFLIRYAMGDRLTPGDIAQVEAYLKAERDYVG